MDPSFYLPTYQDSLAVFVGELRDLLFASQEEAAAYFGLDRSRISRYESDRATPKIGYLAGLVCLLAERRDNDPAVQQTLLSEINRAIRRHYRRGRFADWDDVCQTAAAYLAQQQARQTARPDSQKSDGSSVGVDWWADRVKALDLPSPVQLVGQEIRLGELAAVVTGADGPWLISIEGLGGIGKTALANALLRRPEIAARFANLAWVSAKQQSFRPGLGLHDEPNPALTSETLTDALLEQLGDNVSLAQPFAQKQAALTELLQGAPMLVVIDNLETMLDYETLLPTLFRLANPAKFLLTSRHSLQAHTNVFCLGLAGLDQADTLRFIRQEAAGRGLVDVAEASEAQLTAIYEVAGGNPLALKLVVGQLSVLSLPQVLDNLKRARGKSIDQLYTYIYWQAWSMLTAAAQQLLLLMPLAQGGAGQQLMELTGLEPDDLQPALQQLAGLSLLQIGGTPAERRYSIHRLTETFLLNEAIQWQAST